MRRERVAVIDPTPPDPTSPAAIIRAGKRLRLRLPGGGELHIDRPLPFLFAYHPPSGEQSDLWTSRLLRAEASIWFPSRTMSKEEQRALLVPAIEALSEDYGALLVIEVRARGRESVDEVANRFLIATHSLGPEEEVLSVLEEGLRKIRVRHRASVVERRRYRRPPGDLVGLVGAQTLAKLNVSVIQLGIPPVYRSAENELYPLILRSLRRQLAHVLRRTAHRFARLRTHHGPTNYLALGRQRLVKAVLEVDRRLEEIATTFDFLMMITPTNTEQAWNVFLEKEFEVAPEFRYRPIPIDPGLQKRRLYQIPIERIADPALAQLYEDRRYELDVRLGMLLQRGSRRHLLAGHQLYGEIDAMTWRAAGRLLAAPAHGEYEPDQTIDAEEFARRAREELSHYRKLDRTFRSDVKIRGDFGSVMVSRGRLFVDRHMRLPTDRVEALLQHEVGTHVVTFHNGGQQPLAIFATGLAGYEELQEGLAVLAEHLVGELTVARLRLLAGRVVAARAKLDHATFVETHRLLRVDHGFSARTAFLTTMRAFRAGGSLKDVIYLRGVARLLEYLSRGGEFELLFLGKIAQGHVALVEELLEREILKRPVLLPRYLEFPGAAARLARLRAGAGIDHLLTDSETRRGLDA